MYDLLSRTISQGLQAFLPIAVTLTWFEREPERHAQAGLRWGMLAAVPATVAAMYGFQRSTRPSVIEAFLAAATLVTALWFLRRVFRERSRASASGLAFALAAVLLIVRQTMEIAATVAAILHLGAADALVAL